jgi:mxaK protein
MMPAMANTEVRPMRSELRRVLRAVWQSFATIWGRVRGGFLWLALAALLAWSAFEGWQLFQLRGENTKIAALQVGSRAEIDTAKASPKLIFAKLYDHLRRDELDQAQQLLDSVTSRGDPVILAKVLYDMGNARIRRAISFIEANEIDKATPLVNLAKDDYRRALMINPDNWGARSNFDLAQRLVRDLPEADNSDKEPPEDAPKKIWTDLPGVPKGLP